MMLLARIRRLTFVTAIGLGAAAIVLPTTAASAAPARTVHPAVLGQSAAAKALTYTPVPGISGTPRVGSTLTAATGAWRPAPVTLAYQWAVGGIPVSGATKTTFVPRAADVGKTVTVSITGSKTGYTSVKRTSPATAAVKAAPPTFTASPTPKISGTARVGSLLTATNVTWAPAPVTLSYVWLRSGTLIAGATGSTYRLVAADLGKTLAVAVTGSKSGYATLTRTSAATAAVQPALLTLTAAPRPTISGTAKVGVALTATIGTWSPSPVTLTYIWAITGTAVPGATESTFMPPPAAAGKTVTITVMGTKAGYKTEYRTSDPVTVQAAGQTFTAGAATISGVARPGSTLTAVPGTWSPTPAAFAYAWRVGGTAIAGATKSTYVVQPGDDTKSITVSITGSTPGYASVTTTSPGKRVSAQNGVVHVSGTISTSTTWSTPSLYVVDSALRIASGVVLTVEPGTIVKVAEATPVTVDGSLIVSGPATHFTSLYDDSYAGDTNGDGVATEPEGSYQPFQVGDTGTLRVANASLHYANITSTGVLELVHAAVDVGPSEDPNPSWYTTVTSTGSTTITDSYVEGMLNAQRGEDPAERLHPLTVTGTRLYGGPLFVSSQNSSPGYRPIVVFGNSASIGDYNVPPITIYDAMLQPSNLGGDLYGLALGGNLIEDYTTSPGETLYFAGSVKVQPGVTLTLTAGSIVKFGYGSSFDVLGTVRSNGTSASPNYLTSENDNTVGPQLNAWPYDDPQPGDWSGVRVAAGGVFTKTSTEIRYAETS